MALADATVDPEEDVGALLTESAAGPRGRWQDGETVAVADGVPAASGGVSELLRTAVYCNNATLTRAGDGTWSRSGDPSESALLLACFAPIVWGSDELRRAWRRRHVPTPEGAR